MTFTSRYLPRIFFLIVLISCFFNEGFAQGFRAGAGKTQLDPPPGTPLGAYNWGPRRVPHFPIPEFRTYSTFMMPNQGILNPCYARALVIDDGYNTTVCFVTFDLMAVDEPMTYLAWLMAAAKGFPVPFERCTFTGSHTHSSYAGWMSQFGIQITPTMDLFVPAVQKSIAASAADAMLQAWNNMVPAAVGVSTGLLTNVTHNRRAGSSPYVTSGTIDPHMGILRVDDLNGNPIATAWNFACHGTCYGPDNMQASGDILGVANAQIEDQLGGVALFLQADAGDVSPTGEACSNKPVMAGGVTMGNAAMVYRSQAQTYTTGKFTAAYSRVDLGQGAQDWSLARNENCTRGGPLDICSLCEAFNCSVSLRGGQSWLEETPRLNSLRLDLGDTSSVFITAPVEAIVEYGWWIRNASADMGFGITFFMGYTNSYDMYLCTPNEWSLIPNGYECSLNMWGIDESSIFYDAQYSLLKAVAPSIRTFNHQVGSKRGDSLHH